MSSDTAQTAARLLVAVPVTMRFISKHMRSHGSAESAAISQFRILHYISRSNKPTLSAVADHVGLSNPVMSRVIDGLVAKGLVGRAKGAVNRRRVELRLTNKGRDFFISAHRAAQSKLVQILSTLPFGDLQTLDRAALILERVFEPSVQDKASSL